MALTITDIHTFYPSPTGFTIGSLAVGAVDRAGVNLIIAAQVRDIPGVNASTVAAKLIQEKHAFLDWTELEWSKRRFLRATSVQSDTGSYEDVQRFIESYALSLAVLSSAGTTAFTITGNVWYNPDVTLPMSGSRLGAHNKRVEFRPQYGNAERLFTIS